MRLPEIEGHWLWGSLREFREIPYFYPGKVALERGGIARFRLLNRRFVGVGDPDIYKHVMVRHADSYGRGGAFRNMQRVIGRGMLSTDGDEWAAKRSRGAPAFSRESLRALVPVSSAIANRFLSGWYAAADEGRPLAITQEMQRLTISVICQALFSVDIEPQRAQELCDVVRDASRAIHRENMAVLRLPAWLPTKRNVDLRKAQRAMNGFVLEKLAERRTRRGYGEARRDLLEIILAGREFEELGPSEREDVIDECKTLLVAGFETTALSLSWALHLLTSHPDVAERWHEECDRVLAGGDVVWEDLEKLTYTRQVVAESLRLYPVVFTQAVECVRDDRIGEYEIEKGDILLLSLYAMHRSPSAWEDPDRFDPDRFAEGRSWPRKSYLPFGKGKHTCVGNNFALYEMLIVLSIIGRRFALERVDVPEELSIRCTITLVPDREILAIPRRRA